MKQLTDSDRARYEWQMWTQGVGEEGQRKLKNASVLISRCGGVGGAAAFELAAAGAGRLVIAHAGNLKLNDLNRQLLMTHDWLGKPRIESIVRRLRAFNPDIEIEGVGENISETNAAALVAKSDVVVDAAPLFEERYLMNREAVRQGKILVEAAMYDTELHLTTIRPGHTPCLACLYPDKSTEWKRQFPVFGAVSGTVGCMAAMEAIKIIVGIGTPLYGEMLVGDLASGSFRKLRLRRDPNCPVCGHAAA